MAANVVAPYLVNCSGAPLTECPCVNMIDIPSIISDVAIVASIGTILIFETTNPLIAPKKQPTHSATIIPKITKQNSFIPEKPFVVAYFMIFAASIADKFPIETTDKSIPPVSITIIIAREYNPSSGSW